MPIHKIKMKRTEIDLEYNKFKIKDLYTIFEEKSFDKKHEQFGYYYFINYLKFEKLISVSGSIHGYDGIFEKNGKVYFYEAKYSETKDIATLRRDGVKTTTEDVDTRIHQLENSIDKLGLKMDVGTGDYKSEIELLGMFLIKIRDKNGNIEIPYERMTFALGNNDGKYSSLIEEKLKKHMESLVVEYEE